MIQIGLLGCGTVGSGVVKLLEKNAATIAQRSGDEVVIRRVLEQDVDKCLALGIEPDRITSNFEDIVNDPEIDIVVELIGGIEPASTYILEAMCQGKHVVTANKDLIAVNGQALFETAEKHQVDFYFEASVGGGIPIVYPLKQSLAGNQIQQVIGILNGTTNYILTKMSRQGLDYQQVLEEAQALGYAEADPASDVSGLDAAHKIAILSSIAFNSRVTLDDVYVEGITGITAEDIRYAHELGFVIKLLAIAKENEWGQIQVRVHPAFLPANHPLAAVNDVFNAVYVQGDAVGEIMHFGRGAGQMPTASAVVGDVIEIVRNLNHHTNARIGCTCYEQKPIVSINELEVEYYIRMRVTDRPGVLAGIAGVFGNNNVSIATVLQKSSDDNMAELIMITHRVREKSLRDALAVLSGMSIVSQINSVIRLEGTQRETV
jgi:homoserine dehydrogenase